MTTFPEFIVSTFDDVEKLKAEFRCLICWGDPTDPHVCPHCSGIFCRNCLQVAFNQFNATSCPHCRTAVGLDAYVQSPFVEGILAIFRSALPLPQTCAIHPEKYVQVFCAACDKSACDQCWTDQHLDHQVTAVPAHTFAQYANSIVNYNIAMHGRSD